MLGPMRAVVVVGVIVVVLVAIYIMLFLSGAIGR
jgi:hypothetical protein